MKHRAKVAKLEPKTEERYEQFIRVHLTPAIGHVPLARLAPQTIQDWHTALLAKSLSHTTVRHVANLLHKALEDALKRGIIARNPVEQTDPPTRDTRASSVLTPKQLQTYLIDAHSA